ncbi:hypothetical protein [Streptomyces sp. VB1]|uniref:hypothetical protein n=1 Tax=Streptomyces sp. VB1 TaxID=2986803 RepID=UPI0022427526|nr:hypothetical protein [Streptomyces sp. VB1]UZI29592.1 hypothetical protein OH133_16415 [Streptomyces sp. VB1]
MKRVYVSTCAGMAAMAALLAGCDADAGTAPERAYPAVEAQVTGGELSPAEELLVQRAEQLMVKECMEEAGFSYWAGVLPTPDDLRGGGYVLTDAAWAKRNGYGSRVRERLQRLQRDDPNHAYANALPEHERARYTKALEGDAPNGVVTAELPGGGTVGIPRDSCLSDAKGRLYGDFQTWYRADKTVTHLARLYAAEVIEDGRTATALEAWSACMREAGHDYADPPSVRAGLPSLTEGLTTAKAFAVENGLAVTEARCATRTPLAATLRALTAEYRSPLLAEYGDDVAAHRRMGLAALARAEDITGATA